VLIPGEPELGNEGDPEELEPEAAGLRLREACFLFGLTNLRGSRSLAAADRPRRDLDAGIGMVAVTEDQELATANDEADHLAHRRQRHDLER